MGDRHLHNRQLQGERLHFAYEHVADLVQRGSKVLDLGCGTGELMTMLRDERDCRCTGIDIEEGMVRACVARAQSCRKE